MWQWNVSILRVKIYVLKNCEDVLLLCKIISEWEKEKCPGRSFVIAARCQFGQTISDCHPGIRALDSKSLLFVLPK